MSIFLGKTCMAGAGGGGIDYSQLSNFAQLSDISDFTYVSSLNDYAKLSSLGNYAKLSSLGNYAKLSSLDNYAKLSSANVFSSTNKFNSNITCTANATFSGSSKFTEAEINYLSAKSTSDITSKNNIRNVKFYVDWTTSDDRRQLREVEYSDLSDTLYDDIKKNQDEYLSGLMFLGKKRTLTNLLAQTSYFSIPDWRYYRNHSVGEFINNERVVAFTAQKDCWLTHRGIDIGTSHIAYVKCVGIKTKVNMPKYSSSYFRQYENDTATDNYVGDFEIISPTSLTAFGWSTDFYGPTQQDQIYRFSLITYHLKHGTTYILWNPADSTMEGVSRSNYYVPFKNNFVDEFFVTDNDMSNLFNALAAAGAAQAFVINPTKYVDINSI